MREVRDGLNELDKLVKINVRLKNESMCGFQNSIG